MGMKENTVAVSLSVQMVSLSECHEPFDKSKMFWVESWWRLEVERTKESCYAI